MKYFLVVTLGILTCFGCRDGAKDPSADSDNSDYVAAPPTISLSIIESFPHDTSSFTQGLVLYKGTLYEGTGGSTNYNQGGSQFSKLMKVNLKDGKAQQSINLDPQFFGEGIAILNDTIYQLTWKEHKVFAYTLDFKKVKEFEINTEGWGLTTNGKELILSDGTSNLYFYDPSSFRLLHTQSVTQNGALSYYLNELEYIDGFVYANQWQEPYILKIDPNSGQIAGRIDVTPIWTRIKTIDPMANVPNGIAYDAETQKIYITGKNWPELYSVQFGQ